jgi:AcrR family transcriptional regulator
VTDLPENGLPHAVALSWGVAELPQRGPKRELSIERIVESAIEIADDEGLSAVSMSKVAASLGYTTMSLYRYVTSKDDLLLLMQDAVLDVDLPQPPVEPDWRDELREWVLLSLAVFRAHRWYTDVPITGIPATPNQLRIVDSGLRCLRATGLTDHEKMATILLASGFAMNVAKIERDIARSAEANGAPNAHLGHGYASILAELVTEERFPYLRPVILSGAYTDDDVAYDDTAFGLERLLDGVQHYLDTRDEPVESAAPDARPTEYDTAAERSGHYAKDPKVREIAKLRREAEAKAREADARVRELAKREREALAKARERAAKLAEKQSRNQP